LLVLTPFIQAQNASHVPDKRAQALFDKALDAYRSDNIPEAKKLILKSIDKDKAYIDAYLLLGDLETEMKQISEAVKAYKNALKLDSTGHPRTWYLLGRLQYQQGIYAEGAVSLNNFLRLVNPSGKTKSEAKQLLESCKFSAWALKHPVPDTLHKLDDSVNSAGSEYVNFVNEKNSLLIFTREGIINFGTSSRPMYKNQIFVSSWKNDHWQDPQKMNFPWPDNDNIGAVSFSLDGRSVYFTGCYWPGGMGSCDIYVSRLSGEYWNTPVHLNKEINTETWESQAVVSSDGRYLYFASRRAGGKGGSDLWVSKRQKNGLWGKPRDLGDSINTSGNEMAPFLHADGKTLYFASDGWPGLGGYDLFVSRKKPDGSWSKARNLGYPINTRFNELNIFIAPNGQHAWISSDRIPGKGYDIYEFKPDDEIRPGKVDILLATVLDSATHLPLKATAVLSTLPNGEVVDSLVSAMDGTFMMALPLKTDYALHIYKKGYLFYSDNFNLLHDSVERRIHEKILLQPIAAGNRIRLENIYFKFDQSELSTAAFPELNRLVLFLKQNKDIRVQISGFTDNVGTTAYNLKLSVDRAKAVFDYLVMRGIAASRLSCKGFGNTRPVADNNTPEGRAKNRRTEIVVRSVSGE
jgi:outer membrane protein OmpA-like peptidoglycan-associated protein